MLLLRSILLLLLLVAADGAVDHIKEACGRTPHPELCVSVMSAAPESKTADARGLAQIAMRAAAKMAAIAGAASDAEQKLAEEVMQHENKSCTAAGKAQLCFVFCGAGFKAAVWMLQNATDDDAARLASARYYFQSCRATPYRAWDCARCHVVGRGHGRRLPGVLSMGSVTERFLEVASELVKQATGGKASLPPPSEEVVGFLGGMDFKYIYPLDDCRGGKEPAPPNCVKSGINSSTVYHGLNPATPCALLAM